MILEEIVADRIINTLAQKGYQATLSVADAYAADLVNRVGRAAARFVSTTCYSMIQDRQARKI